MVSQRTDKFKYASVSLAEVMAAGCRFEASVFNIEARYARDLIANCPWPKKPLAGSNGLSNAYHCPRFKRPYVDKPGIPFFQPSQLNDLYPSPARFLSSVNADKFSSLRVKKGQILLTCSGTIGKVSLVGRGLDGHVFSHDMIRMDGSSSVGNGYIYAFLRTKTGSRLLTTSNYGAVIQHIEPQHLTSIQVPVANEEIVAAIHGDVVQSFELRDESNDLMDQAQQLLYKSVGLPKLSSLSVHEYKAESLGKIFCVPVRQLQGRFDAAYHDPIAKAIERELEKSGFDFVTVANPLLSKEIRLPGQFKRVYVDEGFGIVFFGGKDIGELDPSDKKYLAISQHAKRIKDQLLIDENMILVTCSGTIGNTSIVPKHWDQWAMTHDIIRVISPKPVIAGYLYAWLSSEYGQALIKRFSYGAVVQHIEDHHLAEVLVPILEEAKMAEIGQLVLDANQKRFAAYLLEQKAITAFNEHVFLLPP
jgi:type I restriction enzyme, S subunit